MKPTIIFFLILAGFTHFARAQTAIRIPIGQNINIVKELQVSLIAKDIHFIPLETNKTCLLGQDISKIEVFDNTVFVSDYTFIYRFDMNGEFLNRIGKIGKGPGEYLQGFQTFLINKQNKQLIFFEMVSKKMMVYDFEGNFIRENTTDFLPGPAELVNDEIFAVYNMGFTYESEPWKDFYILNRETKIIQKNKFKKQPDKRYGLVIYPAIFYKYKAKTRYKNPHENIIYELSEDKKPKPIYYLDYGKYEKYSDVDDAEIRIKNGVGTNKVNPKSFEKIGILGLYETNNFLFIYYGHQEQRKVGVYDKKEKTFYKLFDKKFELFGLHDDLFGGLPVFPKNGIIGDTMYTHYDAWEIKEYLIGKSGIDPRLKKMVDSIDENDNPVLMIVKLKE